MTFDENAIQGIFCPFTEDGNCIGQCPSARDRACINGQDDD